jgi:uncharacterized protein YcfJ
MNIRKTLMACAVLGATAAATLATTANAQVSFYEGEGFRGRVFSVNRTIPNLERAGFNDRASSVVVERGRWEVCTDQQFNGRCVVLRPGSYADLSAMGIDNRISSVRAVNRRQYDNEAPPPAPAPVYDYRRRPSEKLFDADVVNVRAVVGPPSQRCWVEREQVRESSNNNVGGAIAGALIGGILGHQVGSGRGNDAATAVGAIAGATIGSRSGNTGTAERNVQRCRDVPSARAEYWDVDYNFRGRTYTVQMTTPPGRTILVNGKGEPRT